MALTYGFYNSLNGDRKYNALQFTSIFDGIIRDGIFMYVGNQMVVKTANDGMQVNIQTGRAWFDHSWTLIDTVYPLVLPNPEVLLDKYVAVVLETNQSQGVRANSIKYVAGSPAVNPQYPALINTSAIHQHPLAYVRIRAGASVISQGDIRNMVGTSSCPYVTGPLETVNADNLIAQWNGQWNDFMTADRNQFNTFMSNSNSEFRNMINADTTEFRNMINADKSEWNSMISADEAQWNAFVRDATNEFRNMIDADNTAFNQLLSGSSSRFNDFLNASDTIFNTFMDQHNEGFNQFVDVKNDEFEDAMDEMRGDFSSFWTDFKRGMVEYLREQEDIWQTWFNKIQGQLSDDAATNLQRQIDALSFVFVLGKRAVLGITASAIHERVVFGTYGSVAGERVFITAPYRETVYVYDETAVLNTVATTLDDVAAFGPYGGKTGESVVVSAPTHNPQDF